MTHRCIYRGLRPVFLRMFPVGVCFDPDQLDPSISFTTLLEGYLGPEEITLQSSGVYTFGADLPWAWLDTTGRGSATIEVYLRDEETAMALILLLGTGRLLEQRKARCDHGS